MSIAPVQTATAYGPNTFVTNDDARTCLDVCNYKAATPARLWHDEASGGASAGDGGMTFADVLDAINPLQHLPVISTIYRAITGDKPGLVSELAGGALYGGPIGLLTAGINAAFEGTTGKSDGELVASLVGDAFGSGTESATPPGTAVAEADSGKPATGEAAPQLASAPQLAAPAPAAAAPAAAPQTASIAPTTAPAKAPAGLPARAQGRAFPAFTAARAFPAYTVDKPATFPAQPAASASLPAPAAATGDAQSQRIAAQVAAQQRAQLGLILTNMNAAPDAAAASPAPAAGAGATAPTLAPAMPEKPGAGPANPYMPIASGGAITPAAMRDALDRYQRAIQSHIPPATRP